jgi:hypothetical protein
VLLVGTLLDDCRERHCPQKGVDTQILDVCHVALELFTIPLRPDGAIPPLGYVVFGNNNDKATNGGVDVDFVVEIPYFRFTEGSDRFFWSNSNGPVTYRNSN